jgi:hypothetical protein
MVRYGVILALLFQSLVAICCGNLTASRADGCCGTEDVCCCCATQPAVEDSCCTQGTVDPCCVSSEGQKAPSDCDCCSVEQEMPQTPAEPARRYWGDTQGVAIPPAALAVVYASGVREPLTLALRHEPPWPSGRALLADQCRWNL